MKLQNKKGFTLIELLVVITIIGILATGATTVYTSQIQKARDTTRINDIKAIQSAVEQIYQDKYEYPAFTKLFDTGAWTISLTTYMPKIPRDPKTWQTCNNTWKLPATDKAYCLYTYSVWPDANTIRQWAYALATWFESAGKVESDGTRDGGPNKWRWEVWVWITLPTPLDTDVPSTSTNCDITTNASLSSATWAVTNTCAAITAGASWEAWLAVILWS